MWITLKCRCGRKEEYYRNHDRGKKRILCTKCKQKKNRDKMREKKRLQRNGVLQ
jgi:hypothetical protein